METWKLDKQPHFFHLHFHMKIHVHVVPPLSPFWSVKYLNFGQKLQIWIAHHTFLESRHPEVTKNPYYILYLKGNQDKVSAHGLQYLCFLCLLLSLTTSFYHLYMLTRGVLFKPLHLGQLHFKLRCFPEALYICCYVICFKLISIYISHKGFKICMGHQLI